MQTKLILLTRDRRRANKAHLTHYGILEQSIIYSTKSAEYLHNYILNCRFDAAMSYRCPGCYKIEDFIDPYISLMHQADIYYYVPCRLPSHRLSGIISSDIHHSIGGYYPCTPITRNEATNVDTYSTVITTENIVDINIILHTSQYSRSKQDNIQQSTLGVLE